MQVAQPCGGECVIHDISYGNRQLCNVHKTLCLWVRILGLPNRCVKTGFRGSVWKQNRNMGLQRIFSRWEPKVLKFHFTHSKLGKQSFFAKNLIGKFQIIFHQFVGIAKQLENTQATSQYPHIIIIEIMAVKTAHKSLFHFYNINSKKFKFCCKLNHHRHWL